jgi:catechol 2,3-dioxygenase-like lactoylglutathione lyase family enzyme
VASTGVSNQSTSQPQNVLGMDMKIEVVALPVADVDRSKRFYEGLGWRVDADFGSGEDFRVVQLTPPHSACSIAFGKGITTAEPGSVQRLEIVVSDIVATRADLISRGVEVGEVFHLERPSPTPIPGPDPERRSYQSYATFTDPDGNGWLIQEINRRLPGREWKD